MDLARSGEYNCCGPKEGNLTDMARRRVIQIGCGQKRGI